MDSRWRRLFKSLALQMVLQKKAHVYHRVFKEKLFEHMMGGKIYFMAHTLTALLRFIVFIYLFSQSCYLSETNELSNCWVMKETVFFTGSIFHSARRGHRIHWGFFSGRSATGMFSGGFTQLHWSCTKDPGQDLCLEAKRNLSGS